MGRGLPFVLGNRGNEGNGGRRRLRRLFRLDLYRLRRPRRQLALRHGGLDVVGSQGGIARREAEHEERADHERERDGKPAIGGDTPLDRRGDCPGTAHSESATEIAGALESVGGSLLEAARDSILDGRGDRRRHPGHGPGPLVQDRVRDGRKGVAGEGELPRQHAVEHDGEGEQVRPRVDRPFGELLRSHVERAPEDVASRGELGADDVSDAEVHDLRVIVGGNNDVAWLHVPMNDPLGVSVTEGFEHVGGDPERLLEGEPLGIEHLAQSLPLHVLHHDERGAVLRVPHVEHGGDARMVELSRGARLPIEALVVTLSLRRREVGRGLDELDGDDALDRGIAREQHRAHRASPENAVDLEAAELCRWRSGGQKGLRGRGRRGRGLGELENADGDELRESLDRVVVTERGEANDVRCGQPVVGAFAKEVEKGALVRR